MQKFLIVEKFRLEKAKTRLLQIVLYKDCFHENKTTSLFDKLYRPTQYSILKVLLGKSTKNEKNKKHIDYLDTLFPSVLR